LLGLSLTLLGVILFPLVFHRNAMIVASKGGSELLAAS
jgi:hypothetical protein